MSMVAAQADVLRPEGFRRVARWLAERSHRHEPRWLDVAARTSEDAATALEVQTGQIAKSVIFRHLIDGVAVPMVNNIHNTRALALPQAWIENKHRARNMANTTATPGIATT